MTTQKQNLFRQIILDAAKPHWALKYNKELETFEFLKESSMKLEQACGITKRELFDKYLECIGTYDNGKRMSNYLDRDVINTGFSDDPEKDIYKFFEKIVEFIRYREENYPEELV